MAGPQAQVRGAAPRINALHELVPPRMPTRAQGAPSLHTLPCSVTPSSTDPLHRAPSPTTMPKPTLPYPPWGQDTSVTPSCCGWHTVGLGVTCGAVSPPQSCPVVIHRAVAAAAHGRGGCGEGKCSGMG